MSKKQESRTLVHHDPETGEYLGIFKTKEESVAYFESIGFTKEDQRLAQEVMDELYPPSPPVNKTKPGNSVGVSVTGNGNGTCKKIVDKWLNSDRLAVIGQLKKTRSFTPEKEIATLLTMLFDPWPSKEGHWLYIAQTFRPRSINCVVDRTVKVYRRGGIKKTPVHYFSNEIKYGAKRKNNHQRADLSKRS